MWQWILSVVLCVYPVCLCTGCTAYTLYCLCSCTHRPWYIQAKNMHHPIRTWTVNLLVTVCITVTLLLLFKTETTQKHTAWYLSEVNTTQETDLPGVQTRLAFKITLHIIWRKPSDRWSCNQGVSKYRFHCTLFLTNASRKVASWLAGFHEHIYAIKNKIVNISVWWQRLSRLGS